MKNNDIKEAVILLGGMGTRLLPYTKTVSKEMLPIYDVPAVFLLVKEAYLSGIKRIIFVVTKYNQELIKNFFSINQFLNNFLEKKPEKKALLDDIYRVINNMEFVYVEQDLKGTYGALYSARKTILNDNFIVMYGDDLLASSIPVTKKLIEEFNKDNKMYVVVQEKDKNELPDTGIVKLDNNDNIINLVKKEENNSSCIVYGRMLLNKKIFTIKDQLIKHDNDELYLPYALLSFNNEVKAYKYNDKYFNLGEKTGYIKASIHYALKDENNKKDLMKYLKEII